MTDAMRRSGTVSAHHWGPGLIKTEAGRVTSVEPHPDDPHPSALNRNLAESLNGGARVLRPAVRKSYLENEAHQAPRTRGEEPFVEISWDQALDLVASELQRVRNSHGNNAIFGGSYGWASAGRFHHAPSQLKRFLNACGGFVNSQGNYSFGAALVLLPHIVGDFSDLVEQATRLSTVRDAGRLVVSFGGMPPRNAQVSAGGVGHHNQQTDLLACAQAGVKFINISPVKSDMDDALAPEWLPPIPGSDVAVMMGLAHTLYTENLHDQSFLDRYTVGFDKFIPYLLGVQDGIAKDAEWAEKQSGIPAARIRKLAREMVSQRTLISTAFSLQRADFGEQPLWMTIVLAAMIGQIGLPGGGYGFGYGSDASIGVLGRPIDWPALPLGENPVKDAIPVAMISDMLLDPGGDYQFNGRLRTFPDIRLVWWAGGNPFHHHQDLNRLRQAFRYPETIIVNEINWTATARHADIVLPVAAALERTDFGAGKRDNKLIPMPRVVDPPGEARCEYEIYRDLEQRLQLNGAFSKNRTMEDWFRHLWTQMQHRAIQHGQNLPDWDAFLSGDIVSLEDRQKDHVLLSDFRRDPARYPLTTDSGKIELFSERIAGFQYPDCPGHPVFLPLRDMSQGRIKKYPLYLISGQPGTRLHSQYDNGSLSREKKVQGREPVLINPADAVNRGIEDGDVVLIHNQRGRCLAGAVVSENIRAGVLFLWTGAWYDPDHEDEHHMDRHGNPNVLTHDYRTSQLAQGPAAQSALVQCEKFTGPVPEITAYSPPVV